MGKQKPSLRRFWPWLSFCSPGSLFWGGVGRAHGEVWSWRSEESPAGRDSSNCRRSSQRHCRWVSGWADCCRFRSGKVADLLRWTITGNILATVAWPLEVSLLLSEKQVFLEGGRLSILLLFTFGVSECLPWSQSKGDLALRPWTELCSVNCSCTEQRLAKSG